MTATADTDRRGRHSEGIAMHAEIVEEGLLTARQVASILNVSTRTLWRLKSAGKLPGAVRVGGSVRWRKNDLREWIAGGCQSQIVRENPIRRKG